MLRESFSIPHISSGDLLRAAVEAGSELGDQAKGYMDKGQLVPSELVIGMIRERVAENDCTGGYLLDGFPRTVEQAEKLESMVGANGHAVDHVVALEVEEDKVVERLSGRRSCPECGRLYHVSFQPPRSDGICDDCGAELMIRDDDREETIRKRLEVYRRQTAPLLDFYEKAAILRIVDGDAAPAEVAEQVLAAVREEDD